ncbi:MAG: hypothetical protein IT320_14585 [Anaerolineae bacterium]|nr:hypothetical protein [Anaerolineae bacterium]
MSDLRVWQLEPSQPHALQIAADARLTAIDPADDQTWEVAPGLGERAALALQTRYGGRAGLVSLVPLWQVAGRVIYQAQQYAAPVIIRRFAPAYVQLQTQLTADIDLRAEFWAMDSHAVGGRFSLRNLSKSAQQFRFEVLAFVGMEGQEQATKLIPMVGGGHALALGAIGNLYPMVMMDGGAAGPDASSHKIGTDIALEAEGQASVRFVCAGLPDPRAALDVAQRWLGENWSKRFAQVGAAAQVLPQIETGDADVDATIAFGYMQLMQSFIKAPGRGTFPALLPLRMSGNPARAMASAQVAYATGLAGASVDAAWAQGMVRSILAGQQDDGWIDGAPRLGNRPVYLYPPILARLAWSIFQYTEDDAFLRDVFAPLQRFFERWLAADLDADGDGAPEWQASGQLGFPSHVVAGNHVDVRTFESPGLIAYLLSEASSLREIAHYLREDALAGTLAERVEQLKATLATFWNVEKSRFVYRDRDTHATPGRLDILKQGNGDETHFVAYALPQPERIIVEVVGGVQHTPKFTLTVSGVGPDGEAIHEIADERAFVWQTGRGSYTTDAVFAQVDSIQCDGLVRVYQVSAYTADLTPFEVDALLPLWSLGASPEQADALVGQIERNFWNTSGISETAEPRVETPTISTFFITILGEALLEHAQGDAGAAFPLLERFLMTQIGVLRQSKAFMEYYRADRAEGAGERGHVAGLPPLHLLLRVLGVRVISPTKVWTGGPFPWGAPVRVTQHGVVIERAAAGTRVTFPSGHIAELPADAPWQAVVDAPESPSGASGDE